MIVTPKLSRFEGFCNRSSGELALGLDEPPDPVALATGTLPPEFEVSDIGTLAAGIEEGGASDPFSEKVKSLMFTEVELRYLSKSDEDREVFADGIEIDVDVEDVDEMLSERTIKMDEALS